MSVRVLVTGDRGKVGRAVAERLEGRGHLGLSSASLYALRMMLRCGDVAFDELAIDDAEELCRRLVATPWGWGSSPRYAEAVELLANVQGAGELLTPRDRSAVLHGLLDAAEVLDEPRRRDLIDRGLDASGASVRRMALDRLCEVDGPETALRRALGDPNATVRKWRPPAPELRPPLFEA